MNLTGKSMEEKQFDFLGSVHRAVRFLFKPTDERLVGEKKSKKGQVRETDLTASVGKKSNIVKPILVYSRDEADVWFKKILLMLMKDDKNKKDLVGKFRDTAERLFINNSTVKQKGMIPTNEHYFMGMCDRLGLYKKVETFMYGRKKPLKKEKSSIQKINEKLDRIKLRPAVPVPTV